MANFLQSTANTHNAMSAVSASGASSFDDRYRQSLPLPPSIEKLQININTDSMASSATTSTAACTDVGSFMNAKCDTSSTSTTTPCGAAAKDDADIPSQRTNNSRCTLDQALENLMQRRQRERHHLSIARDLLERLEDDEEDFSSDDDSDDDEESAHHMHISTTCISTSRASTSNVRLPNIERGLRSLAQPKRRERHPFAVAEFFLQDLEEEER